MGPIYNRIHLGLGISPELPCQHDSFAKSFFSGPIVDPRSKNLILGSNIHPWARKNKRCALKNHAESSIRNCKRSHIAQVMAKNHFEGSLQNLGICVKKGNPASKGQGWPSGDLRGKCCFSIEKKTVYLKKSECLACTRRA